MSPARVLARWSGLASLALAACTPAPSPEPPPPLTRPAEAAAPEIEAPPAPDPEAERMVKWWASHPSVLAFDPAHQTGRWFDAAFHLADREQLAAGLEAKKYTPPRGSLTLVATTSPGVEQPRLRYYTIEDTGFLPAPKHFVPASTVKLMASISALWTLSKLGLTGDARLSFKDIDGRFSGSVYSLYKDALLHSSNRNYNRLIEIAGFDETNTRYVTAEYGLPVMAIQSRYGPENRGYGLRVSPTIHYKEGELEGEIPKRKGEWKSEACRGNCTTLFELQDILRRVMLHDELPASARFPLARVDLERIQALLLEARNRLQPSPDRAFGESVDVYNSVGRIPGRVLLENSYLRAPESGRRIFLALSLRFVRDHDPKPELVEMTRELLDIMLVEARAPRGPGLQLDAGDGLELAMRRASDGDTLLWAHAPADAVDDIAAWSANTPLEPLAEFTVEGTRHQLWRLDPSAQSAPLIAIARDAEGHELAYRMRWRSFEPVRPRELD